MAWMEESEYGKTAGTRPGSTAPAAVGDRISNLLLAAIVASLLLSQFGNQQPAYSAQSPPVAQVREGSMAKACRTARWCDKPMPRFENPRWMVQAVSASV